MKKINIIYKLCIFTFFLFIIVIYGFYVYAFITPKFSINTNNDIAFYDIEDNEFLNNDDTDHVKLDDISSYVKDAIISVEDKNFYEHRGFDYPRILKALYINIKDGKIKQGASTISQQYVKNLFLTFEQTWKRKIDEAYLTFELETHYSKNEILEGYLNTIDFGAGNYGIMQASKYYFNKEAKNLTIEEATILVGIPKNPSYYNPITNYDKAKERQLAVLQSMVDNKIITEEEKDNIYNKKIEFYGKHDKVELSSIYYYKDAVMNELSNIKSIQSSLIDSSKLKIYTNLDINVQKNLENSINNEMKNTSLQTASIVIEPTTGKVISLIGGKDYNTSQFNRATSSKRQVGSTIKPFLYYAALENGFTPSTTFLSEKTSFNLGDIIYSPSNANDVYANKEISLLSAIAFSDNVYAMKTHLFLGTDILTKTIDRVKIKTKVEENASSALGTTEINILDYSNGYITLANEGIHIEPYLIRKITDENGNIIYENKAKEEYVLNKKYVYILNNMMTSTYNYNMIDYTSPTLLSVSSLINNKFAVKSGSTDTDYWTIGYNKNYLVMVWCGNDNNDKVNQNDAKIAKKIWAKTISKLEKKDNSWYDIPQGVTATLIDPISGKIATKKSMVCYYEKGTEPNYNYLYIK